MIGRAVLLYRDPKCLKCGTFKGPFTNIYHKKGENTCCITCYTKFFASLESERSLAKQKSTQMYGIDD